MKSKLEELRRSPFIELRKNVDDKACSAVHYELEQRYHRIKQKASRSHQNLQTLAAGYVTINCNELNVVECMVSHNDYGLIRRRTTP